VTIEGIDKRPSSLNYLHDGHDFSVTFNFSDENPPKISGGPLGSDSYIIHGFHIHWPSEHAISNKLGHAELHLVHYNSKYANLGAAVAQKDGLAVLGVMFEVN
jgi:carbonic anhydrase